MPPIAELVQEIIVLFGLPVNTLVLGVLTERLTRIQEQGQTIVLTEIQALLASIQTMSAALVSSSDAGGLIQAGELKWSEGGRLGGVASQRAELKARLAGILEIDGLLRSCSVDSGFSGSVMRVYRG